MRGPDFEQWLATSPGVPRRTLVMGILNLTPDSFSDGGQFSTPQAATSHAQRMVAEGADLIDIGGESTRPGAQPVAVEEQIARVVPVLSALRDLGLPVTCSIDTTRHVVAKAALAAGASVINDISAGRDDPAMFALAAKAGVPLILMHMQGTPATMQVDPQYDEVTRDVGEFLRNRATVAQQAGIERHRILMDPGIGFGKTVAHNLALLRRLDELSLLGHPLVVGTSRKGFIGRILGVPETGDRVFGTAATVAWSVAKGASLVRVHDVGQMVQVVRMVEAIKTEGASAFDRRSLAPTDGF